MSPSQTPVEMHAGPAGGAAEAALVQPGSETLAERYARTANQYARPRRVDTELRLIDIAISGLALVVLSPLIALVTLAIVATSGWPPFYRGQRVGKDGKLYTMYKFRTLKRGAEHRIGGYYGSELTTQTAGEATRVGNVLRFLHLDEIPQLWNVLRGQMSIVGPRPIRPTFFEQLCGEIPRYWQRLVVPPGVTGFAQLRMTRETSWSEKLAHDLEYIADRSPRLYLRVCLATASRILTLPLRKVARACSRHTPE
jgi:lipopolysaccharide/colanic/teichoic acid biosynthesis glycosyltransferase